MELYVGTFTLGLILTFRIVPYEPFLELVAEERSVFTWRCERWLAQGAAVMPLPGSTTRTENRPFLPGSSSSGGRTSVDATSLMSSLTSFCVF